ncbi:class I SAM-dependent methyltransferase [Nanoarchaeota archaeon]
MIEHYFSEKPKSEFKSTSFDVVMRGRKFNFLSGSSTFSVGRIDQGTKILIDYMDVKGVKSILDVGCGIGIIGIVCSKIISGSKVVMIDVNERSLSLAEKNVKLNGCDGVVIKKSDLYSSIKGKFDLIISNPPQKAGKKVCFSLIQDSINHLNLKGSLQIVARHQKGGKELEKKMEEVFGNVEVLGRKSGYRVYKSIKS